MKLQIDVTTEEARALAEAVEQHTRELQAELVHTTDRQYRRDLRERLDLLERASRKLAQAHGEIAAHG